LWADALEAGHEAGVNVAKYKTATEAWQDLVRNRVIEEEFVPVLREDYWARPFRLHVRQDASETVVRIQSDGGNGVNEDGLGDDLYIDVHLLPKGKAKRSFRAPDRK
jgi:hypothetical protein